MRACRCNPPHANRSICHLYSVCGAASLVSWLMFPLAIWFGWVMLLWSFLATVISFIAGLMARKEEIRARG